MSKPYLCFNLNLNLNLNSVLVLLLILPRHPGKAHCYLLSALLLGKKNGRFSKSCKSHSGLGLHGGPVSSYATTTRRLDLSVSPPGPSHVAPIVTDTRAEQCGQLTRATGKGYNK